MNPSHRHAVIALFGAGLLSFLLASPHAAAQTAARPPVTPPALASDTPARLEPVTSAFDYVKRSVMIPMRDGVKLHTVVIVPKGAARAPILLTRTPYNAAALTGHAASAHLGPILQGYDNATDVIVEGGYIRVVQDVRGQVRVGRRLRDEPPAARAAESRQPSIMRPTRTTRSTGW